MVHHLLPREALSALVQIAVGMVVVMATWDTMVAAMTTEAWTADRMGVDILQEDSGMDIHQVMHHPDVDLPGSATLGLMSELQIPVCRQDRHHRLMLCLHAVHLVMIVVKNTEIADVIDLATREIHILLHQEVAVVIVRIVEAEQISTPTSHYIEVVLTKDAETTGCAIVTETIAADGMIEMNTDMADRRSHHRLARD